MRNAMVPQAPNAVPLLRGETRDARVECALASVQQTQAIGTRTFGNLSAERDGSANLNERWLCPVPLRNESANIECATAHCQCSANAAKRFFCLRAESVLQVAKMECKLAERQRSASVGERLPMLRTRFVRQFARFAIRSSIRSNELRGTEPIPWVHTSREKDSE